MERLSATNLPALNGRLPPFNPAFVPTRNDTTGRECTDYAREYVKDMTPQNSAPTWTRGNAQDWLLAAPAGQKYTSTGNTALDVSALQAAPVGSLVVWNGYGGLGHVGVVTGNANGQVQISEANLHGDGGRTSKEDRAAERWQFRRSPSADRSLDMKFGGIIYPPGN